MTVWQVAAGSLGRDYTDRFLRHGMALVGGDDQRATMQNNVQLGDKVILKKGLSQIVAVGRVVARNGKFKGDGDKQWLCDFDGWDLSGWCYVDWCKPDKPIQTHGLTRNTIQGVNQSHLIALADEVLNSCLLIETYEPEPADTEEVDDETLIRQLVELGLRPDAAEDLTQALRRIRRLVRFYLSRDWTLTNEHDARTFLVIPRAEQKLKIELNSAGGG
jgi:hypothetical protein